MHQYVTEHCPRQVLWYCQEENISPEQMNNQSFTARKNAILEFLF